MTDGALRGFVQRLGVGVRQSSGPQQADKHAAGGASHRAPDGARASGVSSEPVGGQPAPSPRAGNDRRASTRRGALDLANASLVAGLVGGIILSICAWMLRRELARAGSWTLLALVGAVVGSDCSS